MAPGESTSCKRRFPGGFRRRERSVEDPIRKDSQPRATMRTLKAIESNRRPERPYELVRTG